MAQTRIANILWKQNSPYGTFVLGDSIDVYWDDSTDNIVVKKNNVVITSGNQIPIVFNYSGKVEGYYKSELYYEILLCDDTNKVVFERITSFPYFNGIYLQNHPSCSLSPAVCDLAFTSLPIITNCSTETSSDGSLTVTATSSYQRKYRLNQDFEYNDSSGQTSGTFSGLTRGNYLVFSRDENNCLAVIGATVGVDYSYGVKYKIQYYSIHTGYHHKTEILEKSYSRQTYNIKGTEMPSVYNLRGEGERDKFLPVLAGEMLMNFISETRNQYSDLYTNDPEKFRMRHSIDSGSGFSVVWLGKVLPNQSTESLLTPKSDVQIIASDTLPSLADVPFLDSEGNRLFGEYKQITLIAFILAKIGLGLSIRSGCNIYATGMNTTDTDDPLDQAYVDTLRYYLKSETPDCLTVLKWILEPYGAQVIQWGNYWNIIRVEERVQDFDYRVYTVAGVYSSNSNYDPIKDLKRSGMQTRLVWTEQSASLRVNPGFGSIRLLYDLGRKDNLLINGDFSLNKTSVFANAVIIPGLSPAGSNGGVYKQISPNLSGFEVISNGNIISRGWESLENENVAITFTTDGRQSYLLSESVNVKMGNADKLKLTYIFAVAPTAYVSPPYVKVKIQVTYGDYFLLEDGSWTVTETAISYFVKPEDFHKYQRLEIVAEAPASSYYTGENLNVRAFFPFINDYDFATITALKAFTTTNLKEGYRVLALNTAVSVTVQHHYYELRNSTDAEVLYDLIRPDDYNASTNPYQWVLVQRGTSALVGSAYTLKIDKIQIEFLNQGKLLPDTAAYEQSMENDNPATMAKVIYHGSITDTVLSNQNYGLKTNISGDLWQDFLLQIANDYNWEFQVQYETTLADSYYSGYLRNATGGGYTTWFRDAHAELDTMQNIFMDMYTAQYNSPWRSINGGFLADIQFSPIDVMRDTQDGNKKYFPIALSVNFKHDEYNSEFHELKDIAEAAGFTTGFTIGFDS